MKQTQGNKKFKQYFDDLKRNAVFQRQMKKLVKQMKSPSDDKAEWDRKRGVNYLMEKYVNYREKLKKEFQNLPSIKHWETATKIAEDYGLDNEFTENLILSEFFMKEEFEITNEDMCSITDGYDEFLNEVYPPVDIEFDERRKSHIRVFPVSIDIHKFATKRDVIDFVEKRWEAIQEKLEAYTEKKVRFRKRKLSQKLLDFIWDNRGLDVSRIKELLDKAFPENTLVYYEIHKILSLEKRRRLRKIIVGQ